MIELNEKDIKVVAQSRFTAKHTKHLIVWAVVLVVYAVLVGLLFPKDSPIWLEVVGMIPLIGFYTYGAIWWIRGNDKACKELIEQWQKDTGQ